MEESIHWNKIEDKLPDEIGRRYIVYSPDVGVYSVRQKLESEDSDRLTKYFRANNVTHWAYINPPEEERLCFYIWLAIDKYGKWIPLGDIEGVEDNPERARIKGWIYDWYLDNIPIKPCINLPCVGRFKFYIVKGSKSDVDTLRCGFVKLNDMSPYKQTDWRKEKS